MTIIELFDWLSRGCPDGVPLRWLQDAWRRTERPDNPPGSQWGAFDHRFPWRDLTYSGDDHLLVRRRAA